MANPVPTFYSDKLERMVRGVDDGFEAANQAGVTASGSAASEQPTRDDLMLELSVTANDGDLTVTIEDSPDDATWTAVDSFADFNAGATGTDRLAVDDLDQYVRVTWTAANMTNGADFTVNGL